MTFEEICIQRYGADSPPQPMPPEIGELRASKHPFAHAMAEVLEEVISDTVQADETAYIEAIEARRAELEGREDEIAYLDFGAATKFSEQTPEEMYEGVLRERSVGSLCRRSSKPYRGAVLLLKLIRRTRPALCIELGAGLGLTAAFQAAALRLNDHGRLITLEGPDSIAAIAEETLSALGHGRTSVVTGRWQDTLAGVLDTNGPVDFAFIDGHHDKAASIDYFNALLPHLADGAVFILDDIRWSEGMLEAWEEIRDHARVEVSVDLVDTGICWIASMPNPAERFRLT